MNGYDKLKSIIQQANPEIMELKFGCEVKNKNSKERLTFISDYYEDGFGNNTYKRITLRGEPGNVFEVVDQSIARDYKNLGRPIRLSDVLLAISKVRNSYAYAITEEGEFIKSGDIYRYNFTSENVEWNRLNDNLDNQSEETKQFLIELLV